MAGRCMYGVASVVYCHGDKLCLGTSVMVVVFRPLWLGSQMFSTSTNLKLGRGSGGFGASSECAEVIVVGPCEAGKPVAKACIHKTLMKSCLWLIRLYVLPNRSFLCTSFLNEVRRMCRSCLYMS